MLGGGGRRGVRGTILLITASQKQNGALNVPLVTVVRDKRNRARGGYIRTSLVPVSETVWAMVSMQRSSS